MHRQDCRAVSAGGSPLFGSISDFGIRFRQVQSNFLSRRLQSAGRYRRASEFQLRESRKSVAFSYCDPPLQLRSRNSLCGFAVAPERANQRKRFFGGRFFVHSLADVRRHAVGQSLGNLRAVLLHDCRYRVAVFACADVIEENRVVALALVGNVICSVGHGSAVQGYLNRQPLKARRGKLDADRHSVLQTERGGNPLVLPICSAVQTRGRGDSTRGVGGTERLLRVGQVLCGKVIDLVIRVILRGFCIVEQVNQQLFDGFGGVLFRQQVLAVFANAVGHRLRDCRAVHLCGEGCGDFIVHLLRKNAGADKFGSAVRKHRAIHGLDLCSDGKGHFRVGRIAEGCKEVDVKVVLSYFSGAVVNTIVISAILLTAGIAFSCISGSSFPEFTELLKLYGLVILGSVSAVLILMFVASFFKKNSTYAAFNTLISVAIGFVIGAYIPVSQFSDGVQTFVNLIPGSHIAAMIRNVLVSPCINDISTSLAGADHGMFAAEAEKAFATNLNLFGNEVDFTFMMMYSIGAIVLFLVLNLISYKFSSKRKD